MTIVFYILGFIFVLGGAATTVATWGTMPIKDTLGSDGRGLASLASRLIIIGLLTIVATYNRELLEEVIKALIK